MKTDSLRYLALGDSYTVGHSVGDFERWPTQLTAMLRELGLPISEPTIIAKTGWTTDELLAGIKQENPEGVYELVSLLIGVNNQYRGLDIEEYRDQFRLLLQQAIDFAGKDAKHVIVLSIPDWGVTPYAENFDQEKIMAEIDRFNAVLWEETEKAGAWHVDIVHETRKMARDGALIAEDGLHPSGRMYETWACLSFPAAYAALATKRIG